MCLLLAVAVSPSATAIVQLCNPVYVNYIEFYFLCHEFKLCVNFKNIPLTKKNILNRLWLKIDQ